MNRSEAESDDTPTDEPQNREERRAATQIIHSPKFVCEAQERQRKAVLEREAAKPPKRVNHFNNNSYRRA
jgi:hypothetical protein